MGGRPTARDPGPELQAGRIGRPHGLDGSFHVTDPRSRLLTVGTSVTVAGQTATIVRRAGTELHPIVRLEGVEDRPAAELLRGLPLMVQGLDAPALAEDEWWAHELEGCEVVGGELLLGTVSRLIELPSCEALEVRRAGGPDAARADGERRRPPCRDLREADRGRPGLPEPRTSAPQTTPGDG